MSRALLGRFVVHLELRLQYDAITRVLPYCHDHARHAVGDNAGQCIASIWPADKWRLHACGMTDWRERELNHAATRRQRDHTDDVEELPTYRILVRPASPVNCKYPLD